ncbi:hypothetical protein LTR40_008383, partial [Exophiala xenobiotica]
PHSHVRWAHHLIPPSQRLCHIHRRRRRPIHPRHARQLGLHTDQQRALHLPHPNQRRWSLRLLRRRRCRVRRPCGRWLRRRRSSADHCRRYLRRIPRPSIWHVV